MDRVLELQVPPRRLRDVEGGPGIGRLGSDVQKQRAVRCQRGRRPPNPFTGPIEVLAARNRIVVAAVLDSEIVGGRRDNDVDGALREPGEHVKAVAEVEAECCASGLDGCVGRREAGHRGDCTAWVQPLASGGLGSQRDNGPGEAFGRDRVIAPVSIEVAPGTLLFDICQLAARSDLTIPPDHASARHGSKPKQPHETHSLHPLCSVTEQVLYR